VWTENGGRDEIGLRAGDAEGLLAHARRARRASADARSDCRAAFSAGTAVLACPLVGPWDPGHEAGWDGGEGDGGGVARRRRWCWWCGRRGGAPPHAAAQRPPRSRRAHGPGGLPARPVGLPSASSCTESKREELIAQLETLVQRFPTLTRKPDLLFQLGEATGKEARRSGVRRPRPPEPAAKADHRRSDAVADRAMECLHAPAQGLPQVRAARRGAVLARLRPRATWAAVTRRWTAVPRAASATFPPSKFAPMPGSSSGTMPSTREPRRRAGRLPACLAHRLGAGSSYATYKLAWCDFNLGQFEGAREKLAGGDGSAGGTRRRCSTSAPRRWST
jgi:hypothetical protein